MTRETDTGSACGECAHYAALNEKQGVCYRYPPVPYPVPVPAGGQVQIPGQQQASGMGIIQARPPVGVDELACGEFEPIPEDGEKVGGTD